MRAKLSHLLIAMCLASVALMASSTSAQAYDAWPCLDEWYKGHPANAIVQYCPDWSPDNWIPVHERPSGNSRRVGRIYAPGNDWYVCQLQGDPYGLAGTGYWNSWWALTYADGNLARGYVNQVYFRGGDNNELDRKLRFC
jgi:hypothetical protein